MEQLEIIIMWVLLGFKKNCLVETEICFYSYFIMENVYICYLLLTKKSG